MNIRFHLIIPAFTLALIISSTPVNAQYACQFYPVTTPLTDLGASEYMRPTSVNPLNLESTGVIGGLYPNGQNVRPQAHEDAGLSISSTIVPLDSAGNPSTSGLIGMGSIGMSNTNSEFDRFMGTYVNPTRRKPTNDKLKVVNTASGGSVIERWVDPTNTAYNAVWNNAYMQISNLGLTPEQMQVFWIKVTNFQYKDFPEGTDLLTEDYVKLMHELNTRFPNLKTVYFSSRTRSFSYFGGLSPEPTAFENGIAVRNLIERQLSGDPELNYNPNNGDVRSPWISWGPYLWIDGENPRSDGMVWLASDVTTDCTHPSSSGMDKVALMLWNFFSTDTTTRTWFLDAGTPPPTPINQAPSVSAGVNQTITLGETLYLNGIVSDDGLPTGSQVTSSWSIVSAPGNVIFDDSSSPVTTATLDAVGTYELQLYASDGLLNRSDNMTVVVEGLPVNYAPVSVDSTHNTRADTQVTFNLQYSDANPEDTHTISLVSTPSVGTYNINGNSITYTPDGVYLGDVQFVWNVTDGELTSANATSTISITEIPSYGESLISYFDFTESGQIVDLGVVCSNCVNNGATWTSDGHNGGAYTFDGVNDLMNLSSYNKFNGLSEFTYSVWVKPTFNHTATTTHYILNNNSQIRVFYLGNIRDWRTVVRLGGSDYTVDTQNVNWEANTWQLLTITYDGSTLKSYWNGVLLGSKAASGSVGNVGSYSYLGGMVGANVYFNGVMDEIKLFDTAFDAATILDMVNE